MNSGNADVPVRKLQDDLVRAGPEAMRQPDPAPHDVPGCQSLGEGGSRHHADGLGSSAGPHPAAHSARDSLSGDPRQRG